MILLRKLTRKTLAQCRGRHTRTVGSDVASKYNTPRNLNVHTICVMWRRMRIWHYSYVHNVLSGVCARPAKIRIVCIKFYCCLTSFCLQKLKVIMDCAYKSVGAVNNAH